MARGMIEERAQVSKLSYKEGFATRLNILFNDVSNETDLVIRVSHVFDTVLNGIYSASHAANSLDERLLSPNMYASIMRNRLTVPEAKQLYVELKEAIVAHYGIDSIPLMNSLWNERAKHIGKFFNQDDAWTPFTNMELAVAQKRK